MFKTKKHRQKHTNKMKRILSKGPPKQAPIAIRGNPCLAIVRLETASEERNTIGALKGSRNRQSGLNTEIRKTIGKPYPSSLPPHTHTHTHTHM